MLKNFFNELMQAFSQTIFFKRRNIFQNLHKTCPLTEQVSIATQCRVLFQITVSWTVTPQTLWSIYQYLPITHSSIHHMTYTVMPHSDAQHPNSSWSQRTVCLKMDCLVQSGYTNALWVIRLVCIWRTNSREATLLCPKIESFVKLWIDDNLNVFTGQGAGHKQ